MTVNIPFPPPPRRFVVVALFVVAQLLGFATVPQGKMPSPEDRDAVSIVNSAAGMPVEFQSAALFRLIHANKISSRKERILLLKNVFYRADSAIYPNQLLYIGPDANETLEGRIGLALADDVVDGLSIKAESARLLAPDDPKGAAGLLDQVLAAGQAQTCESPFVSGFARYFASVESVFASLQHAYPKGESDNEFWLEGQIGRVSLLGQIAPALRLAASVKVSAEERDTLLSVLSSRLANLRPSSRDLSSEVAFHDTGQGVVGAARVSPTLAPALVGSYRRLIEYALSRQPCADQNASGAGAWNSLTRFYNSDVGPMANQPPITEDARRSTVGTQKPWTIHPLDDMGRFQGLLSRLFLFRDGPGGYLPGENDPQLTKDGWQSDALQILDKLQDWNSTGDPCPLCVFARKGPYYLVLIDLLPAGSLADRAVSDYLAFMGESGVQHANPALWIEVFRPFLLLTRSPDDAESRKLRLAHQEGKIMNFLPSPFAAEALNEALKSQDPVIQYLASLERLSPVGYHHPSLN